MKPAEPENIVFCGHRRNGVCRLCRLFAHRRAPDELDDALALLKIVAVCAVVIGVLAMLTGCEPPCWTERIVEKRYRCCSRVETVVCTEWKYEKPKDGCR